MRARCQHGVGISSRWRVGRENEARHNRNQRSKNKHRKAATNIASVIGAPLPGIGPACSKIWVMCRSTCSMSFASRRRSRLGEMLVSGEYVGWLASPDDAPDQIVAALAFSFNEPCRALSLPWPARKVSDGRPWRHHQCITEPEWRRTRRRRDAASTTHRMGASGGHRPDNACTPPPKVAPFTNAWDSSRARDAISSAIDVSPHLSSPESLTIF